MITRRCFSAGRKLMGTKKKKMAFPNLKASQMGKTWKAIIKYPFAKLSPHQEVWRNLTTFSFVIVVFFFFFGLCLARKDTIVAAEVNQRRIARSDRAAFETFRLSSEGASNPYLLRQSSAALDLRSFCEAANGQGEEGCLSEWHAGKKKKSVQGRTSEIEQEVGHFDLKSAILKNPNDRICPNDTTAPLAITLHQQNSTIVSKRTESGLFSGEFEARLELRTRCRQAFVQPF